MLHVCYSEVSLYHIFLSNTEDFGKLDFFFKKKNLLSYIYTAEILPKEDTKSSVSPFNLGCQLLRKDLAI